ncbi:major facilitator superfamily domain-containing protein [Aspergillus pseudoustus]|uniref:Major facilitator superfamily domain-containing protein n=1 Tax=Aspergillus pseudoustus TaxID=1810923 RepID=A0ABR4JWZ4_9EURO
MATNGNNMKIDNDHIEVSRSLTVEPLPDAAKAEGGIILDTRGLVGQSGLQLAADGHTVLVPQPTSNPNDPLNWPWLKKHLLLFTIAWAALCVDATSAIGTAVIFPQAEQWQVPINKANEPNAMSVLFNGIGGLIWVPVSSFWGRAPVLFWTTIMGLAMLVGTALSPTYECYFALRILSSLFLTAGQTMVIAFIKDIFFFHERARKIGVWSTLYIASPYLGPCLGNFMIYATGQWQHVFWLSVGIASLQLIFVALFVDETWYNRHFHSQDQPARPRGIMGRLMRLTGVWQLQGHKAYFPTPTAAVRRFFLSVANPVVFLMCLSYIVVFAWAIGINITTTIMFGETRESGGYGYTNQGVGFLYFTPIVAVFLGEIFGHYFNDFLSRRYIRRHGGVFEPEARLWMIYISIVLMVVALVILGAALERHLNVAAVIFGWGTFVIGVMTMSVVVTAYTLDAYPTAPAEMGGWINFSRTIGGFSVGYFQTPWAARVGPAASFGTQAATIVVAGVPVVLVHVYGHRLRRRFPSIE